MRQGHHRQGDGQADACGLDPDVGHAEQIRPGAVEQHDRGRQSRHDQDRPAMPDRDHRGECTHQDRRQLQWQFPWQREGEQQGGGQLRQIEG
ncbi:MAG: hypothetical protein VKK62_05115 [Synechococcaceae cyanobacterium]|nr:hypothetical protein [Synechococcaceae cyanobacterium]